MKGIFQKGRRLKEYRGELESLRGRNLIRLILNKKIILEYYLWVRN